MSIATVEQMRGYLTTIKCTAGTTEQMQDCLDRATATIEGELGFSFTPYAAAATARRFNGGGGKYLHLPYHLAGSLVSVQPVLTDLSTSTEYIKGLDYELDPDDHTYLFAPYGWARGRYEATAKWGYGEPPADIVQVCLELAINLWLGSQGGQFSDVVGIEGAGAVGYNRQWTNRQRGILEATKVKYGNVGFA